ncbi:phospholipid/cholesterol/gamma-HCH transport system ATP-binding protein [Limimonas halophila]|uniref:Phospholipid/cholesterol/gamma-HCH transport system ATP-binding protein n=1 Tax=Limimonas halophila TaxID=1082479 RepID=A0A1G7MDM7_9PROT|nr:ATP-binding cassette domain-containing protein [Limimonas halophila]SDF59938.1 phospholipid/cholesterol/gamma-HCH transport system ATP-binding protein [Limimonas halophila]
MSAAPKIRCRDLHKAFGANQVLRGLDLDVMPGESVVVIGGSGTGKSVLLKCILNIIRPDSGSIQLDGQEATKVRGRERDAMLRRFGMLFQNAALFDSLPVWKNVAFALIESERMDRDAAREAAEEKLAAVGLRNEVADLYPAELSGGMKKRVGLARAIATAPEIIFFDEPTTGLDPIMGDVINELILGCVREQNVTTLSITHDIASARKIGHRIAMLHQGEIIWTGSVAEMDATDNPYVQQFIHGRAEGPIQMPVRRL